MKRISPVLIAIILSIISHSAKANIELTIVSGHMNRESSRAVHLYQVIEGKKVELSSTQLDAENNFAFALTSVREGFYYISDQGRREFTRIYLKAGDKLELELGNYEYKIVKGSAENQLLQEWFSVSTVVTAPAFNWMKDTSTYTSYFPKLEESLPALINFKSKVKSKNSHFNTLMKMTIDQDLESAAMYFLMVPRRTHPKKDELPAFYQTIIKSNKYPSASLLELGDGVEILRRYVMFNMLQGKMDNANKNRLLMGANLISNDTLKGAFIADNLGSYKTYENLEADIAPVKQYLLTDSLQAVYFRALKAVSGFKKGSPAYNFTFEDMSGKKVSMQDLKGKVVLIDMWATWCGPCKKEIPFLKSMEEEFKGKEVAFVSISVDAEKDKEKWKDMIEKEELSGIQLFAGQGNDVSKYYDINAIPRFMVFDKDGKIVTVDAPRPSTPELKTLLENTLSGK